MTIPMTKDEELVERLRYGRNVESWWELGAEAATRIEELLKDKERLTELEESWSYLHKWVERGLFCPHTTPQNALECIAHHPSAPWKNGRWDVDHKPYAMKFYAHFPKARAALAGDQNG